MDSCYDTLPAVEEQDRYAVGGEYADIYPGGVAYQGIRLDSPFDFESINDAAAMHLSQSDKMI